MKEMKRLSLKKEVITNLSENEMDFLKGGAGSSTPTPEPTPTPEEECTISREGDECLLSTE